MATVDGIDPSAAVASAVDEHERLLPWVRESAADIGRGAAMIVATMRAGGRLLACGNGGSAADAQHIAAEFVGRFTRERRPYSAIALHANTSAVTAIGNDYGFDEVFARQVAAHGRPGDVLLAISTSGGSPNVLRAIEEARRLGLGVIGLAGQGGGEMAEVCDVCLAVPSAATPRAQEMHILVGHILCDIAEDALCR